MKRYRSFFASAIGAYALAGLAVPAQADFRADRSFAPPETSRTDQSEARKEMRAGNAMKAQELKNRFFRTMRMPVCKGRQSSADSNCIEYLRYDYDRTANAYRFKYIYKGRVEFIDFDARTGRVINRSR